MFIFKIRTEVRDFHFTDEELTPRFETTTSSFQVQVLVFFVRNPEERGALGDTEFGASTYLEGNMMGLILEDTLRKMCPKAGKVNAKEGGKVAKLNISSDIFTIFGHPILEGITFAFPTDLYYMLQISIFFFIFP